MKPMVRGDHSFAISLGVSLIAHAVILSTLIERRPQVTQFAAPAPTSRPARIFIDDSQDASLKFGTNDGQGTAANASSGDTPMVGRDADQAQAFLSRDPAGPGKVGDDPSMSVLPQIPNASPDGGIAEPPPMVGAAPSATDITPPRPTKPAPPPAAPTAAASATPAPTTPPAPIPAPFASAPPTPAHAQSPTEITDASAPGTPTVRATPSTTSSAPTQLASAVNPTKPAESGQDQTSLTRTKDTPTATPDSSSVQAAPLGSSQAAADPAIMSDSESDPFAPGMKVEFRDGRVEARLGRKVKTVRPKLDLAAIYDLQSTSFPSMTVKVHVDAEGAVRNVEVVKSSGSVGADQAVKIALYQWWFEPPKDPAGHAIGSEVTFPITWR